MASEHWPHAFDELRGRRALVTGSSTGIGAAVATALGACGMAVAVHHRESEAEARSVCASIEAAGGRAHLFQADLGADGASRRLVEEAAEMFGGLDLLVNNAGSILGRTPTLDVSEERYRELIDLNLSAVFFACQAALPPLKASGGAIVNTTSPAARMGGGPGTVAYAAAKGGVSALTRGLAKEFAADGVRVNAVAPGYIQTPLQDRHSTPETMEAFRRQIPMGHIGTAQDCVGAYLFLASKTLSGYVTGQVLEVNGGFLMP